MDQVKKKVVYSSILGCPQQPVIVSLVLPAVGEHGFHYVDARDTVGQQYWHYGFRPHPESRPVNVHVYGESTLIEYLARTGKTAKVELELVVKQVAFGREFIFANLYLTKPWLGETHEFVIVNTSPKAEKRPGYVYTTQDMGRVGFSVRPL
jgi:hypothetical protein